jgi:hypothetical protein
VLRHKIIRVSAVPAGLFLYATFAFAEGRRVEVAGYGGGITVTDGGVNPLVGGSAGVRVYDHLRVFGDFNFSPLSSLANSVQREIGQPGISAKARLYNYSGGVNYSFGSEKSRVVPYVMALVGATHFTAGATGMAGKTPITVSMSQNMLLAGAGGGVRLYAGNNWGVKPEFRYQRYGNSEGSDHSMVFSVGLFYQFGK